MTIPGSVTEIPDDMISGCINLTDVTFRYGVQKIAYRAFGECPKLKSVTIPNSVTYIAPISPNVFCEQPRFVVYGYNGSAAKTWAIQSASWGAEFVALDLPFTDVTENDYFVDPVRWATNEKITAGTGDGSTFSPSATCTNAQILSFLWRAAGSPDTNIANPFQNVSDSAYYAKAAIWAYENGIVDGSFNPDAKCTRATAVTYMWKYAGSPAASGAQFKDVPAIAPYAQAVSWAVKANITAGTGADTFSPNDTCTRAQIVTFLYRGFAEN